MRENVEPIVRFAEFGGQIANRRLGRQIGAVKPDRPGRRVALGGERLATLPIPPDCGDGGSAFGQRHGRTTADTAGRAREGDHAVGKVVR